MVAITQQQLDVFKGQYPHNPQIQNLTLAEVLKNTQGQTVNWQKLLENPPIHVVSRAAFFQITDCEIAVAKVIVDVVLIAIGASSLAAEMNAETIETVAVAAEDGLVEIEKLVADLNNADGAMARAKAVFAILSKIVDIGCLGAIISAIFKSLSWWDMILYGIVSIASIVALVATDGAAFAIEILGLVISGAFLMEDVVNCIKVCSAPHPTPVPGVVALCTSNGHYMTVVNGGGVGDDDAALNSDRPHVGAWEKFTVVPIDKASGTFALKCSNGQYLTATLGGGIGGPNNHNSPCHTNATKIANWEQIQFVSQDDGTIAISTFNKYWITAVNGGGWPDPQNNHPFRTNTVAIGPWETFTLHPAIY